MPYEYKDEEIEEIEKKYFEIISTLLKKNIGRFINQIYSQKSIKGSASAEVSNVIERAIENIIEAIISEQLHWNICSMPVSSDSCFEVGDAIVHIDAKSILNIDNDAKNNKVNVEKSQTTYCTKKDLTVGMSKWRSKLNMFENHLMYGLVPNVTYIIKIIYSADNYVEGIKLISLPHGQLVKKFGGSKILGAGKSKKKTTYNNIRFLENGIKKIDQWRIEDIFIRKT